ncbi:UNVERIFIED_CONTAM: hypothetical protein FKN15_064920 [Acipenser sinensis]
MPSSLFADMERNGSSGETHDDQRALQIALELSLLGLDNDDNSVYDNEPRRKSVNMTECVPVPSSEHVAEIVGRQVADVMFTYSPVVLSGGCCSDRKQKELSEPGWGSFKEYCHCRHSNNLEFWCPSSIRPVEFGDPVYQYVQFNRIALNTDSKEKEKH